MIKKKKTVITLGFLAILIIGIFGKYRYDQYRAEQNRNFAKMSLLFMVIDPEDKNLRKPNYTDAELKAFIKNPPKIEIDTGVGLGLKVSAYNYYNAKDINPYTIQEMMESGQFHEAYEYTADFIHWSANYPNEITAYQNAIEYVADKLENPLPLAEDTTYQDYLNIINNPNAPVLIEEYYEIKKEIKK